MRLLPATEFSLHLADSPAVLRERLAAHIEPIFPPYLKPHKEFVGNTDPMGFSVKRIGFGRNSVRPWARGTFSAAPRGTVISVRIELSRSFLPILLLASAVFGVCARQPIAVTPLPLSGSQFPLLIALHSFFLDVLSVAQPAAALGIIAIALVWPYFKLEATALRRTLNSVLAPEAGPTPPLNDIERAA